MFCPYLVDRREGGEGVAVRMLAVAGFEIEGTNVGVDKLVDGC